MGERAHVLDKYLLADKLPHMWCPGCGNGIVLQSLLRAVDKTGINQNEVVLVAGIGCSSRANGYTDFCGIHTNHGRAIAYATGVKMYSPKLTVIVITGDGDCLSIGGNHFIHAARRNIDLTVLVFNNSNYGMTGGQYSPSTPLGAKTKTSVYGNIEPDFDICTLARSSGATYVARSTTYHATMMVSQLYAAIRHKGFSVVDAACDCPTLFGRLNKRGGAAEMILRWKDVCVTVSQAASMSLDQLKNKIVIGEFVDTDERKEYTERYAEMVANLRGLGEASHR